MKIEVIKEQGIYDVYLDGQWEVSRGSLENVLSWIADKTQQNGPAVIVFTDHIVM